MLGPILAFFLNYILRVFKLFCTLLQVPNGTLLNT